MTQSQRESLLDLLSLAIFADSHISLKEDNALESALDSLGWDSTQSREIFLYGSVSRAREASSSDDASSLFIAEKAKAFSEPAAQTAALDLLQKVFASDGIAEAEATFLNRVRRGFAK